MKLVSRKAWGARSPREAASRLASTKGVKVHYTGDTMDPRLLDDHDRCSPRVRQIQNGHMGGNGWNDIGYSAVVCPHGYVFVGRGPRALPSANGAGLNTGHYAVCGLVGNKGLTKPTTAMLHGIRDAIEWLRREGGAGKEIKGHRDGYATDCPGGPLYAWVKKGAPRPDEELDMNAEEVFNAVWGRDSIPAPPGGPSGPNWKGSSFLTNTYRDMAKASEVKALRTEMAGLKTELAEIKALLSAALPKE